MDRISPDSVPRALHRSDFLHELLAEREEILRHKWLESEKAGGDIGMDAAVLDWSRKHRSQWRHSRHPCFA